MVGVRRAGIPGSPAAFLVSSFAPPSPASRASDSAARRRWRAAALSAAALLVVPLAVWLAVPAPEHVRIPRLPAPAPRVADGRPLRAVVTGEPPLEPEAPAPAATAAATPAEEESVVGEVRDPKGEVAAGAVVKCALGDRELVAETDEAGEFRFAAEAAGCRAVASKPGFDASPPELLRSGSGNRLRLSPPTGIAGAVVDEVGHPVPAYWVGIDAYRSAAGGPDGGALIGRKQRFESPEGTFLLTDLAPGRYELAVSVVLGPMARTEGIEVTAGLTEGVRIVVRKGVTVIGTVSDAATRMPIDGARVFVLWGGLSTRQPFTRGGTFTLENAPVGRFDLRVLAPGYTLKIVPGLEGRPSMPALHVDVALEREPAP